MRIVIVVDIPTLPEEVVLAPNAKEENEEDTNASLFPVNINHSNCCMSPRESGSHYSCRIVLELLCAIACTCCVPSTQPRNVPTLRIHVARGYSSRSGGTRPHQGQLRGRRLGIASQQTLLGFDRYQC